MEQTIEILNLLLAIGGVILAKCAIILTYDWYSRNRVLEKIVLKYALFVAFCTVTLSTVMTLVYSEVFGFVPCGLCWLQRVFLYPQVILLGMAIRTKDVAIARYGIGLSIPGVVISLYQHYLQMGGTEFVTCPVTNTGDCSERILFEFGFMTFPLMSAFLFLFLIALYWYLLQSCKINSL